MIVQTQTKPSSFDDKLSKLIALGAGEFDHVDGSLVTHLIGTRDVLKRWSASEALQDAGLFHAAYSTAGFGPSLVAHDQRQAVIDIIGENAEAIVYHHCACNRELFYPRLIRGENPIFADRFSEDEYEIDTSLLTSLCELSVANEVEIATDNPKFIGKHGTSRYEIYSSMTPYLSAPAKQAIEDIFGPEALRVSS